MGFNLSSLAGGPGGGILGSLFGGSGSQVNASTQQAVASQDVLQADRPYYAQLLRQLYDDPAGFLSKIPGYNFQLQQGEEAVTRNAAATGGLNSGILSADLVKYAEGNASSALNQYTTILAGLAESGSPSYANILAGGGAAKAAGNQAIGGNIMGILSSLFKGGSSLFGGVSSGSGSNWSTDFMSGSGSGGGADYSGFTFSDPSAGGG